MKFRFSGVVFGAALAITPAIADVLTFQDSMTTCSGSPDGMTPAPACVAGANISVQYGDSADVDVSCNDTGNAAGARTLIWTNTGYGDLTAVAFAGSPNSTSHARIEIRLKPTCSGCTVTLNSFDMGTDHQPPDNVSRFLQVVDLNPNINNHNPLLRNYSPATITPGTHSPFSPGVTSSTDGLAIDWTEAYYVGISNIDFTVNHPTNRPPLILYWAGAAVLAAATVAALIAWFRADPRRRPW
jgi:hypothetical protein